MSSASLGSITRTLVSGASRRRGGNGAATLSSGSPGDGYLRDGIDFALPDARDGPHQIRLRHGRAGAGPTSSAPTTSAVVNGAAQWTHGPASGEAKATLLRLKGGLDGWSVESRISPMRQLVGVCVPWQQG